MLYIGDFNFRVTFTIDGKEKKGYFTTKNTDASMANIFRLLVLIDYKWLVYFDGRQDREEKNIGKGDLSDRYFSFIWTYLENATPIKNEEFQELFAHLRSQWPIFKQRMDKVRKRQYTDLSGVYKHYHPDNKA